MTSLLMMTVTSQAQKSLDLREGEVQREADALKHGRALLVQEVCMSVCTLVVKLSCTYVQCLNIAHV